METSIDILKDLSAGILTRVPSKKEINANVEAIVSFVNSGDLNSLDIALAMKSLEELTTQVRKQLRDKTDLIEEAEKHGKGKFTYKGADIQVKEAGVSYDFSSCNDNNLKELESEIANLVSESKDRKTFLKSLKKGIVVVDEDTGETNTIYPPVKKSTTTVMITLPKDRP